MMKDEAQATPARTWVLATVVALTLLSLVMSARASSFASDGETIELDEYKTAMAATVTCIEKAGVPVVDIELDATNLYSFTTYDGKTPERQLRQTVTECEETHLREVSEKWADQVSAGMVPVEFEAYWAELVDCLDDRTLATAQSATPEFKDKVYEVMRNSGPRYGECRTQAETRVSEAMVQRLVLWIISSVRYRPCAARVFCSGRRSMDAGFDMGEVGEIQRPGRCQLGGRSADEATVGTSQAASTPVPTPLESVGPIVVASPSHPESLDSR